MSHRATPLLLLLLALATPAGAAGADSSEARPWRYAAPDSTLDAEAGGWATRRRTMALVVLGSTLLAGAGASVLRRRARGRGA